MCPARAAGLRGRPTRRHALRLRAHARRACSDDGWAETLLRDHRLLVLPAPVFHHSGWFRLSLTATPEGLDRGLRAPRRGREPVVPSFRVIGRTEPCFGWDGASVVQALPATTFAATARRAVEGAFAGVGRRASGPGSPATRWASASCSGPRRTATSTWPATRRRWSSGATRSTTARRCRRTWSSPTRTAPARPTVRPMVDPRGRRARRGRVRRAARRRIRATMDRYVGGLLAARPGPVVVCLSGGLDSTSVAALVREQRDDVVAVTFDLARPRSRRRSDDFLAAHDAARHLGLEVVPAIHSPERLFELMDTVLVAGIDWRDFNVHAGLVNAGLAVSIAELVGARGRDHGSHRRPRQRVPRRLPQRDLQGPRPTTGCPGCPWPRPGRRWSGAWPPATARSACSGQFGLQRRPTLRSGTHAFLRLPDEILGPGPGKARLYRAMFGTALPLAATSGPRPGPRPVRPTVTVVCWRRVPTRGFDDAGSPAGSRSSTGSTTSERSRIPARRALSHRDTSG